MQASLVGKIQNHYVQSNVCHHIYFTTSFDDICLTSRNARLGIPSNPLLSPLLLLMLMLLLLPAPQAALWR